jgi:glycine dehydrogenase subunit 1
MSYISLSDKDRKEMMAKIGITSLTELFRSVPKDILLKRELNVPPPMTEPELIQLFEKITQKNKYQNFLSFLGAGA